MKQAKVLKLSPEVRRKLGTQRSEVSQDIKTFLRMRGFTVSSFSRQEGINIDSALRTISGLSHSVAVLDSLKKIGVPTHLLFDPRDYELCQSEGSV